MYANHNDRTKSVSVKGSEKLAKIGFAFSVLVLLSLAFSCSTGGPADDLSASEPSRTAALTETLDSFDVKLWEQANWTNNGMFNCGWVPDHAVVAGGMVTLTLDNTISHGKAYTSGEFRSQDTFSYGKFTARMKAAKANGIVSSFFLYTGKPWDEIDFEVLGKDTTKVQLNYFVNGVGGHEKMIDLGFDASADFHDYTIEYGKGYIIWYVDNVERHRVTGPSNTLPSHPMQIMVNLWPGIGVDSWLNPFVYSAPLTASYDSFTYVPAE